ncbi:myo-inositol 2-dehydrogenase, partial [Vibrio anguillarum]|nr:myo-inositol 2-dehydrogenase [Vibrio anguillarum]
ALLLADKALESLHSGREITL